MQLPPPVLNIVQHWRVRRHAEAVTKPKEVPVEVGQIRDLQLLLVDPQEGEQMRTWNELMVREPQGKRRLVGRHLRYLVGSAHGWLGAVGFSASALHLEARDRWIGWDAQQRQAHEGRVVNLSRYAGTCFQAANWECVGQTKGRGRNDGTGQSPESINLQKAIDAERSRQVRDLSGVPTAAHFTQWVTNAIAANICG